ncbi:MAG: type II toxin-antitoxin system prevent-host-death family antitoxin [Defluviitaleaceae bacterium]|nr:type II toxin-antitoxin system prevent-host-death family antitoxin [Defluviitaleaceae bacterium]
MILIRPVSDLRYKFPEIKKAVSSGKPVYLTKNGYGVMVIMSIEKYAELTGSNELNVEHEILQNAEAR